MALELNDNIDNKSPKILDNRYSLNGVTPYVSVAQANATIPLTYRAVGLTVNINGSEFWYKNGITDLDLVPKSAGDANYVHTQVVASTTWTVIHNLGKKCAVEIVDDTFKKIYAEVTWDNDNQVTISFNQSVSGYVYCN